MKAKDLVKTYVPIEAIYKDIEAANRRAQHKIFFENQINISDEVKYQLMQDGFIVHTGDWDGMMTGVLIIEW